MEPSSLTIKVRAKLIVLERIKRAGRLTKEEQILLNEYHNTRYKDNNFLSDWLGRADTLLGEDV